MNLVETAILIAIKRHQSQKDKSGQPYILHLLRVMLKMENEEEMIPAVLHDVLEDTNVVETTLLSEGIPFESMQIIKCLTRDKNENYMDYIKRIKKNPIAVKIKKADLLDNINIARLHEIKDQDLCRLNKYLFALEELEEDS